MSTSSMQSLCLLVKLFQKQETSTKELVERVADYCNGKHKMDSTMDSAVLKERVKVLAERYASARPDQVAKTFSRISDLYHGTSEDEVMAYATKRIRETADRDEYIYKQHPGFARMLPVNLLAPYQALKQEIARLSPYVERVATMRGLLAEAAATAGIRLAATPPQQGRILGGCAPKVGTPPPQPA